MLRPSPRLMSALGQKQTLSRFRTTSALPPKADMNFAASLGLRRAIAALPNDYNRRYAAANLWVGRSNSQTTITALTTFQIRPLRNAAR